MIWVLRGGGSPISDEGIGLSWKRQRLGDTPQRGRGEGGMWWGGENPRHQTHSPSARLWLCGGGREGHLWAVAEPGELNAGSGYAGPFPG